MNIMMILSFLLLSFGIGSLLFVVGKSRRQKKLTRFNLDIPQNDDNELAKVADFFDRIFSNSQEEIEKKFLAAGIYDTSWAKYYSIVKYGLLFLGVAFVAVGYYWFDFTQKQIIMTLGIWVLVLLLGPDMYMAKRKKDLQKVISAKMPYMLDLLAVCVQTGMTIEAAVSYLSLEFGAFDKDLSHMLKKVDERARLVGLEQALSELYERIPSNEIRSFVMTLNQSLQYGSSIYSVLTTLSADIREVQLLHVEEKIGQLSSKMSIPLIIFIMVPIVILIAGPGIMRLMQNGL
ncbi:type II secretion system F family protein [Vibrio tritonius]|uniref:type II secretion system F family protein n=1 Tax=Vibrio tritonius TaxID=1435069 RepID=UPI00315D4DB3